jgi:hypothetical protein
VTRKKRVDNADVSPEPNSSSDTQEQPTPQPKSFSSDNDTSATKKTGQRVSFSLKEDGTIDWESMRGKNSATIEAAIKNDPRARTMISGVPEAARIVQPGHVVSLLGVVEYVEQFAVPKIVESKTKGQIKANSEIAAQVFKYSEQEKKEISEPAAIVLDDHLPMVVKTWLAKTGPVSEMLAALAKAEQRKIQSYVGMCLMSVRAADKANGAAVEHAPEGVM